MTNPRNPNVQTALTVPLVGHPTGGRTAVAEGLEKAGLAVVGARQEAITNDLTSRLLDEQTDFLANIPDDIGDPVLSGLDLEGKSVVEQFTAVHARLQDAAEQGTVPVTELKIRQERILRDYMRRYPQLTDQFQRAAAGHLGYNPIGAEINALAQANQLRQSQALDIMKMVHQAAKEAGVNPMLMLSHPDLYFESAWQALSDVEDLARLDRNLKAANAEGAMSTIQARRHLRSGHGGIMYGIQQDIMQTIASEVGRAMGHGGQEALSWAETIAKVPPEELKGLLESGFGDQLRVRLTEARYEFVQAMRSEWFSNSDMTVPQLMDELRPQLELYDFAIANISDAKLAERLNSLATTAKSDLFVRFPELHGMMILAEIMNNEKIAAAIHLRGTLGTAITESVGDIFREILGGRNRSPGPGAGTDPTDASSRPRGRPVYDDRGRVQPRVEDVRIPPSGDKERDAAVLDTTLYAAWDLLSEAQRETFGGMTPVIRTEEDELVRRKRVGAAVGAIVGWANFYQEHFVNAQKLLPREQVDTFFTIMANPLLADVFEPDNDVTNYARSSIVGSINEVLQREANQTRVEYVNELQKGLLRGVTTDRGPSVYFMYIDAEWDAQRDRVVFSVKEDAAIEEGFTDPALAVPSRVTAPDGRMVTRISLPRAETANLANVVASLNQSPAINRWSEILKVQAHLEGHTDYRDVTGRNLSQMLGFKE